MVIATLVVPLSAKTRAVLVGVSDYQNLDAEFDLYGPKNDVREFARFLLERGIDPADLTILTTPSAGLDPRISPKAPLRKNILDALDKLASTAKPGDRVIFYFSGHGSQQLDRDGDELGGSDEIFLPADVGKWNGGTGKVENAITDDELRVKMLAIRNAGATLFAIIDACHAATGFRGINGLESNHEKSRFVSSDVLGVPEDIGAIAVAPQKATPPRQSTSSETNSDFVYFYATQSDQRAYEHPIVKGGSKDQWFGDFTLNLIKAMRNSPNASYRQIMQSVVERMRGRIGAKLQQPDLEGTILDKPVWGNIATNTRHRYRIKDGVLQVGILSGINNNSVLALYSAAGDGANKVLAHARVVDAGASQSSLMLVKFPCKKMGNDCDLPDEISNYIKFGEVIEQSVDVSIVFSEPMFPLVEPALILPIEKVIRGMMRNPDSLYKFDRNNYDISLIIEGRSLIIGGPNGEFDVMGRGTSTRFRLPRNKTWAEHLPEILLSAARVHTLYQLSDAPGVELDLLAASGGGLKSKLLHTKAGKEEHARSKCFRKKRNQDDNSLAQAAELQALTPQNTPKITHCDRITVVVENRAKKPQDVTILYVGARFAISPLWPIGGKSNRIAYGEKINVPIQIITRTKNGITLATGQERIVIFSVPVENDTADRVELTGLTQPGVSMRGKASVAGKYLHRLLYPQVVSRDLLDERSAPPLNVKIHDFLVVQPEDSSR